MLNKLLATKNEFSTSILRVILGMALALVIAGGGRWSLDRLIADKS